mmetsp:Transcript_63237/g.135871  ORF Transcript_63237/g.135871 Transcript_63237/m.135871 type:complete len:237 (+) Transcript_63237:345-1055(+)
MKTSAVKRVPYIACILESVRRDRHHHALTRGKPEGPLPCVVLAENAGHTLHGPEDGPVHDYRPCITRRQCRLSGLRGSFGRRLRRLRALGLVTEVEAQGKLEVKLDRPALVAPAQGILELDIDLGAIERPVALVHTPLAASFVQGLSQLGFGTVPQLLAPQCFLRSCAQGQRELEAEQVVDVEDEPERVRHLVANLVLPAEDVRVVLLEAAHTRKPREGATQLVPVQDTEGGEAKG